MNGGKGRASARSATVLARLLRYGDHATLESLAEDVASGDTELMGLLSRTASSDDEELELRVRCVEVLALALRFASQPAAGRILDSFLDRIAI